MQEHLDNRGPGQCEVPVEGADGVERSRVRLQERKLETVFGTVSVERAGYGQEGEQSLHPLDANMVKGSKTSLHPVAELEKMAFDIAIFSNKPIVRPFGP